MKTGYYWYRLILGDEWKICFVSDGYVYFFGQVSQEIGNEYLTKYVVFDPNRIERQDVK